MTHSRIHFKINQPGKGLAGEALYPAGEDKKPGTDRKQQSKMMQKGFGTLHAARKINFTAPVFISLGR